MINYILNSAQVIYNGISDAISLRQDRKLSPIIDVAAIGIIALAYNSFYSMGPILALPVEAAYIAGTIIHDSKVEKLVRKNFKKFEKSLKGFLNENKNDLLGLPYPEITLTQLIGRFDNISSAISWVNMEKNPDRREKVKTDIKLLNNFAVFLVENSQLIKKLKFLGQLNGDEFITWYKFSSHRFEDLIKFSMRHSEEACTKYVIQKISNSIDKLFKDAKSSEIEICLLERQLSKQVSTNLRKSDERLIKFDHFLRENAKLITALKSLNEEYGISFRIALSKLPKEKQALIRFAMDKLLPPKS